ncbi:MAG: NADH-quinone oxidoreductase subunit D [Muribaculaceae bacterium]|nr:NADH-quinone oxidoreductase subunit D [Muribaculaceae bacterium]
MATLQDKIAKLFPSATFEQGEMLQITIPDARLHDLAKTLREDADSPFDYLVTIVGMDWKDKMGCIYYLTSSVTHDQVSIVVTTDDVENPMLHSVSDIWSIAGIFEREVYDFFGIIFIGNPDMRRLFLNIDWVGYPLRKNYDFDPELNPVSIENERQSDGTDMYIENAEGKVEKKHRLIFAKDDFVVNIGPQHPATHGVLRFRTAIDGETVKKIDVYMGYIHRGIEKLCENLGYPQSLHFMDRMDYFSAHQYHHGLCLCYEKALGIEAPIRAQYIRVIMDELSRIASHCLFAGTFCMDLGATTMLFYTLRVREQILDIMDKTCGARMTFNYDTIGGVMADLDPDFVKDVHALLDVIPKNIKEYNKIFTGNVIAKNRMEGVGVITREQAIDWSVTGPSGRASGWACDLRKNRPYAIYDKVKFEQVVMTEGDAMARFKCRIAEIQQSADIIAQLIDNIPEGEIQAKVPKVIKLPAGRWWQEVEGCRGVFGVYLESDGGNKPYRLKLAPPCLPLAAVMPTAAEGQKIADLITIGGSFDYIIPDMDR